MSPFSGVCGMLGWMNQKKLPGGASGSSSGSSRPVLLHLLRMERNTDPPSDPRTWRPLDPQPSRQGSGMLAGGLYLRQAPHEQHSKGAANQTVFWVDARMADSLSESCGVKLSVKQHSAVGDCLADVSQAGPSLPSLLCAGGPGFGPQGGTSRSCSWSESWLVVRD